MEVIQPYLRNGKILFIGVGNVLKADDGAGVFLTKLIRPNQHIQTLIVETGLENYIGKINSIAPDLTILVDAADMGKEPGWIGFIPLEATTNCTTNTHNIALKNLAMHLHMKCMVLGVQPADLGLGKPLSGVVQRACESWANKINTLLPSNNPNTPE